MVKFLETIFYTLRFLATWRQKFDYPEFDPVSSFDFPSQPPPFVTTTLGSYEGYFMKVISGRDIYAFEGIYYAEQPERFKAPRPKLPFSGILSAKGKGKDCVQPNYAFVINSTGVVFGNEDCLFCNIYTPKISTNSKDKDTEGYPVIINFFGGGFGVGSSNDFGPAYLLEKDLILVNCNYRVGVHGFLSTGDSAASGNWGLKDAALAVNFVHSHIQAFGGNPDKIILFGQSAGAALVHLLLLTPAVNGKVAGAVCFSGNAFIPFAIHYPKMAQRMTKRLATMSWCPTSQGSHAMVNCLRRRNPKYLALLQNFVHITEQEVFQFRPVVEPDVPGALLKLNAEQSYQMDKVAKIPIIFSLTSSDAGAFYMAARAFRLNHQKLVKTMAVFLSNLLILKGELQENHQNVQKILEFYGGIEYLAENPGKFFNILNDGLFRMGTWKSLRLHGNIAPTYAMEFGYKARRGIAGKLFLDPWEFETPHSEELFYIFNRTDIEPVPRSHPDFKVVQLFQTIFEQFGKFGKLEFTEDFNRESTKLISANPVDTRKNTFDMAVIGQRGTNFVEMMLENNLTRFWEGLNYL